MQTIYDDKGNEQDYIITTRSVENKLSNKNFRRDNLPIICNYYIEASSLAIKQVEILQDTTNMDYKKTRGVRLKLLGIYQIYNYQKNDSVYVLANCFSKVKYELNYSESNFLTKKLSGVKEDYEVKLAEEVDIYRVKKISYKKEDLELELKKDVYKPLDEMRKLELFSPLFLDTVKYRYE